MDSNRPLLIPSPRTPATQDLPYNTPDLLKPLSSSNPIIPAVSSMDSTNPIDNCPPLPHITSFNSSSSLQNLSSIQSKASVPMRYGSRGADSEALSISQKEINDEDARLIHVNDAGKTNDKFEFAGNSIRTGKYSILTFFPRNLFEQFHRVAYIYFLVIAVLNQLPQLAVFGRAASILPLAFVLLVTAVKDAYEDWRRHQSDRIENNRLATVLVNDQYQQKKWKDIRVGEIIKISASETIPCDMVLLSTSDPTGVAYIQTINLDGESNLKTRYAKQETLSKIPDKDKITGLIKCEKPNRNIYGFQANMEIDEKRVSLGPSNIILRGCEIKNTSWVVGVAVYAGQETKAMLNNSGAPSKRSRLETRMNREIILLSLFLVALCTVVSICAGVWLRRYKDELDYLPFFRKADFSEGEKDTYNYSGWGLEIFFIFLMSVIVFQIMIPISLYISMELVRVGQAYFMIRDTRMYDEASDSRFQCRALNINEDLGQIKYVFSDKTGTLTENKMEFQCASIWGVDYSDGKTNAQGEQAGYSAQVDRQVLRPKMKVKVDPELLRLSKSGKEGKHVHDFFLALAACNTIVPLVVETSEPTLRLLDYQGESPDEQALVYAAAAYGFVLIERTSGHIVIDVQGERHRYNVLGFARSSYETASTALIGRAALLRKVASYVETNLNILGASGIEDKLQQGVPEAIESLRMAGIKVWVLTGDKQETAISIGYSSRLLTGKMTQIIINNNSKESCKKSLEDALIMSKKLMTVSGAANKTEGSSGASVSSVALIIDGTSLVYILDTELEDKLFQLASKCSVVLCCRVAPLQKAGIVALIKKQDRRYDPCHWGCGQEGRQAVMASDFAMGQFRFLVPLLLVHGHWNYQRMGYMILYNFYRNAVFVLVLFWYVLFTCFTLTTAITEWSSVLYSVLYTSLPTIIVGILDKDLGRTSLLKYPQLYGAGQREEIYNAKLFWLTIMDTLWQSIVAFFLPLLAYWESTIDGSSIGDLWTLAVVILVNVHLAMDVIRWTWITHASIWGSIIATCICVIVIDAMPMFSGYWAIFHLAKTGLFWLCLIGISVGAMIPRFVVKLFVQYYRPSDIQIAREAEKFGNFREFGGAEIEMNPIFDPPRR
ncbi:aminophospholipid ATPase 1 [Actinidia rufa]|uniref:Phospholipid-transporting ATPase n=1 Tax=Actinidia rufa TaxID=165716 RepID=A0A7J0E417_9ERIC|nr:aminophospholipid ATPase 1 [Actinidia rufa]